MPSAVFTADVVCCGGGGLSDFKDGAGPRQEGGKLVTQEQQHLSQEPQSIQARGGLTAGVPGCPGVPRAGGTDAGSEPGEAGPVWTVARSSALGWDRAHTSEGMGAAWRLRLVPPRGLGSLLPNGLLIFQRTWKSHFVCET